MRVLIRPTVAEFESLFESTLSSRANAELLTQLRLRLDKGKYSECIKIMSKGSKAAVDHIVKRTTGDEVGGVSAKANARLYALQQQWSSLQTKISSIEQQLSRAKKSFCFSFVEGLFISALRAGDWVLLDEINLAPSETLERIASILDSSESSVTLTERGDVESVPRHCNFRLFACMNPPTDVGKRDLPQVLKARFSEIYVDELEGIDELAQLVAG